LKPSTLNPDVLGQDLEIPQDLLKEYIAYARSCVHPKLNDEATEELIQAYGTLRQDGRDRKVKF
jgi:DNA replicative helicase MCM subunit Mcm2 (Cdc46/Mcm family)